MLWQSIVFNLGLCHHYLLGQHFRQELILDSEHFHYRRLQASYKKKLGMVKNAWIVSGLITLAFPIPPVAVVLSIITIFISFSLLDETE